jgi:amino acid transporter
VTQLKRTLGLPALTLYGLGTTLGAGIYSVLGPAAGLVGDAVWMSFVVSSLAALLVALSYSELATAFPRAGAEYVYLRAAFPRSGAPAFAIGMMMAASGTATAATVALAFAGYLEGFVELPAFASAGCMLVLLTAVALWGMRESAWLNIAFTSIEVGGLLLVIGAALFSDRFGAALEAGPSLDVIAGASLVFFSYLGFENIVNLAEEAHEPERTLPRAIILSLVITTLLYVLVALAAVALAGADRLANSRAPLALAVAQASPALARVLGAIALFATANTALASILSAGRVLYGMAQGGDLPRRVGAVGSRRKTPWVATLIASGAAMLLLPLGRVELVASVSSFAALIAFTAVHASVIALRYREPERSRPFRVPLRVGRFPLLPALGAIGSSMLLVRLEPAALLVGASLLISALLAYTVVRRTSDRGSRRR